MTRTIALKYLSWLPINKLKELLTEVASDRDISISVIERCSGCGGLVHGPHACPGRKDDLCAVDIVAIGQKTALIRALVNNKMAISVEQAKKIVDRPLPNRLIEECSHRDATYIVALLSAEGTQARIEKAD